MGEETLSHDKNDSEKQFIDEETLTHERSENEEENDENQDKNEAITDGSIIVAISTKQNK